MRRRKGVEEFDADWKAMCHRLIQYKQIILFTNLANLDNHYASSNLEYTNIHCRRIKVSHYP